MPRDVELAEVFEVAAFRARANLYKCMPGIVTAGGSAAVDVQPAVHDVRFDPVLGTRVSEPWQIIPAVRVLWPKFGPFALVGKLAAGDKVLLVSPDMDPTVHQGTGNAEGPADTSRHTGAYWLAFPVDITDAGTLPDPGAFMVLGEPGGVQVQIGDAGVSLGAAGATAAVALATKIDSLITILTGVYTPSGTETGFGALVTALATWKGTNWTAAPTVGATKVKGA